MCLTLTKFIENDINNYNIIKYTIRIYFMVYVISFV